MEPYQIEKRENAVVVRATSFRAERRSVLHSGVFNREFASSLAAGAVILVISFFFAHYDKMNAVYFAAMLLIFAALFVMFRIYVFREAVLETEFDGQRRVITLSLKRTLGGGVRTYPMDELKGIVLEHFSMEPENIDAVQLVERVAVQHGTVIPGFGKTEEFYTVKLDVGAEKPLIFSSRERKGAESMVAELKASLKGFLPDIAGRT